ncbi:hypothetical protein QRX50_46420 [Amycolatopsis carbonis]|uniref:Uncharacterized protein n=1 Tax=Amycolatopsis carbonis TaxID=715471 RepID=A0A9Y2IGQ6_9PSEU|nr:hypothetical protein [Amycolatopsis sp. 2-15]WIX78696.1 hypothetical protein QRX50_46420 [Amycolatopsis sp. 2-15]
MRLVRLGQQPSRVAEDVRAALASLGRGSTVIGGVALIGARPAGGDRAVEAVVVLPKGVLIVIGVDLPDPALRLEAPLGGPWKADGWPLVHGDDAVNPATEALDLSAECERRIAELAPGSGPVGTIVAVGPYVETVDQPPADLAGPVRVLHPTPTTMLAATVSLATARSPRSLDQARALIGALAPDAPAMSDEVLLGEGFVRYTDDPPVPVPVPAPAAVAPPVSGVSKPAQRARITSVPPPPPVIPTTRPVPHVAAPSLAGVPAEAPAFPGSSTSATSPAAAPEPEDHLATAPTESTAAPGSSTSATSPAAVPFPAAVPPAVGEAHGTEQDQAIHLADAPTESTAAPTFPGAEGAGASPGNPLFPSTAGAAASPAAADSATESEQAIPLADGPTESTAAPSFPGAQEDGPSTSGGGRGGALESAVTEKMTSPNQGGPKQSGQRPAGQRAMPAPRPGAPGNGNGRPSGTTNATRGGKPSVAPAGNPPVAAGGTPPAAAGGIPLVAPAGQSPAAVGGKPAGGPGGNPTAAGASAGPGSKPTTAGPNAGPGSKPTTAGPNAGPGGKPPVPAARQGAAATAAGATPPRAVSSASSAPSASGSVGVPAGGGAPPRAKEQSRTVRWVPVAAIGLLAILLVTAIVVAATGGGGGGEAAPAPSSSARPVPPPAAVSSAPAGSAAPSLSFEPRASSSDQRCASHAFGDVQASLQQTSCSAVSRASYTALVDGRAAAVTMAVVQFPDAAQATHFKQVADTPGGGGILDVATETGKWPGPPPQFDSAAYASKLDGTGVRLVQVVWQSGPSTPDDPGLSRAAQGALALAMPA